MKTVNLPTKGAEGEKMVESGNNAFIADEGTLVYTVTENCEKFAMADFVFNINGLAFAFPKNYPYLERINYK